MGAGRFIISLRQWNQLHAQLVTSGATHHRTQQQQHLPSGPLLLASGRLGRRRTSTSLWNTILRSCSLHHPPGLLLHLYRLMLYSGDASPDAQTFTLLFAACALSMPLAHGQAMHATFVSRAGACCALAGSSLIRMYSHFGLLGSSRQVFNEVVAVATRDGAIWASMVGAYVRAGRMGDAHHLLDRMPVRNVVGWTSLISGYARAGHDDEAIRCFRMMLADGIALDPIAIVSVLPACGRIGDLELGKRIHRFIIRSGIDATANLSAALIGMYAKCGDVSSARRVFNWANQKPLPLWNAIVDAYCKLGDMGSARALFENMGDRDCVSFNSMISGYVRESRPEEALRLFNKLRMFSGADEFATAGALSACANLGALHQGKALHAMIIVVESHAVEIDVHLGTALLDMYAKCGRIDHALMVFERMDEKDVSAWTAMISGLAMHGKGRLALEHFASMQEQGIRPNNVTYVGVLNACSHSGLLDEGWMHWNDMQSRYGMKPDIEHYGCMVDLLGRRGCLREAEQLICDMDVEVEPNDVIWNSLLRACKIHRAVNLAERVAKNMLLRPGSCEDGVFVQLYNIYVDCGRWEDALEIRSMMEKRGFRKPAGWSSIFVGGQVHRFSAGDRSHPEIEETLQEMAERLSLAGYTPVTSSKITQQEYTDEERGQYVFGHSERLAVAYGIMRLGQNLPIHVLKNLRICEDCHSVMKMIARIWNREIVVRDRSRFHHFMGGHCSCGDFW